MRKGISFTLTIIITAVVLMTAALTLVTLFGSSVGSFFGAVSDTSTDARIRQECSTVLRRVDQQICSKYTNDNTDALRTLRNSSFNTTCDEERCSLDVGGGTVSFEDESISTEINIDGDDYDCADEGYIPENCPVSDSSIY